jgi:hypothetical protein
MSRPLYSGLMTGVSRFLKGMKKEFNHSFFWFMTKS